MSDIPASTPFGWAISTRSIGDVLAARAQGHGIELVLLSRTAGHEPAQIEAWLTELIGVAVETSRNDPGDRPISALLRHALTGLLFSHAELWHHTPDDPPCSMAFVTTNDRVAFGWAGPAVVEVGVGGQRFEGPVIRVRDPDRREAQAVEVESWQRVGVKLTWQANPATGAPAAVEILGDWQGRAAVPGETVRAAQAPGPLPEWRTPSWLGQHAPWEDIAPPATPELVAPQEPAAMPMREPVATPMREPLAVPMREPVPMPEPAAMPEPPAMPEPAMSAQPLPLPITMPFASPTPVPAAPAPGSFQTMSKEERAAELAPDAPAAPAPPVLVPPALVTPELAAPAPSSLVPPELVPPELAIPTPALEAAPVEPMLEIIRPIGPGPPAPPPAGIELVRGSQAITPITPFSPTVPLERPAPPALTQPALTPFPPEPEITSVGAWRPTPAATSEYERDSELTAWAARAPSDRDLAARGRPYRAARRPSWPTDAEPERPRWLRHAPIAIAVLVLFAVGWILGGFPGARHGEGGRGPLAPLLARFGLGPAHFMIVVDSHPQGAWIALDGKDLARRTPATIEAAPGAHKITLSVANLGHVAYQVSGERDNRVDLDATLWGSLTVNSMDKTVAVKVTVDGIARGLAPVTVDSLAPGVHQVQFWSPGAGSWDQIVEVRVRESAEVAARPFASPLTGLLEVRAIATEEGSTQSVPGAAVWLDGVRRGVTPLKLELPRGPHSVRVSWRGQDSPVQVIDLPGGNQRFASFDLDAAIDRPQLNVASPGRLTPGTPAPISATLEGMMAVDVREMWLHVSTPEGQWRRYPMNVIKAPGGAVGTVLFPTSQLDDHGRARYYVSVSSRSGDEVFTEIQTALGPAGANTASTR